MPKDTTAPFWKHCSSSPTFARMKPIQQEICSKSWTMSLAHDPVRDLNNSPAKAGLVEGQVSL
jgi:hypothetical protein